MTFAAFSSLLILLMVGSWTPGPNNAFLSASGMRFGYRATLPHAFGVVTGHALMEFSVALGLGKIYQAFPIVAQILSVISTIILLWFAYKIATAPVDKFGSDSEKKGRPWRFHEGFFFQWINPKAWIIAVGVSGKFASGDNALLAASFIGLATLIAGFTSSQAWTIFGVAMARVLNTPRKRRAFNLVMAALVLYSVVLLLGGKHN